MRYNGFVKSIAIVLAVCTLAVTLCSGVGLAVSFSWGMYGTDYDSWYEAYRENEAEQLAVALAESYAARTLGNMTKQELQTVGWGNEAKTLGRWRDLVEDQWCYTITKNGLVCETDYTKEFDGQTHYRFELSVRYPKKVSANQYWDQYHYTYNDGRVDATAPTVAYEENSDDGRLYTRMENSPEYTVTIHFKPDAITQYNGISLPLCKLLMQVQHILLGAFVAGFLMAAACLWWLFAMAGKTGRGSTVHPGGLNRLPLDIYALAVMVICVILGASTRVLLKDLFRYRVYTNPLWLSLAAAMVLGGCLCITGFLLAAAAQGKLGIREVWKRSAIGWCWGKLWALLCWCWKALCKLFGLLPLIWQYLLVALAMAGFPMLFGFLAVNTYGIARGFWLLCFFAGLGADVVAVLYGAYAFGTLLQGAEKLASGELQTKISTAFLFGPYKKCGKDLNALGEVSFVAAEKQLRSERMKAELITNVSHDIKTPLTSVINYIDLLQKAENDVQREEYLQVLERQSQRLKKLIDDLMDMSKASTGNLSVDVGVLDAVEVINQALGEFADKMKEHSLTVVFKPPEAPVPVLADGKLTWRVMSNILSNAVKYALPGTRVYVDVQQTQETVSVSFKNISGEPLNVSAQELMERFVRGDASRNTEGSGLGLNIAQSLMQLQKGALDVVIDGDLFKTILTFPVK